ncbi:MAG TPA: type II secretion system protein GspM [Solirubrobacteraceae bacterium]|nr:type II secretion system protein GspM [Solirubrobacteraceae bacterium]
MSARDRLVVAVIAAVLVAGGFWVVLVSPERAKVGSLQTQIGTERAALTSAQSALTSARGAAAGYVSHVHQISTVKVAVPTSPAEAALIKTITHFAGTAVDFKQLDVGTSGASAAGPASLSLTFTFLANYGNLQSFLANIDALTSTNGDVLSAKGRLFTIESVSLVPDTKGGTKATVIAEVYQQSAPVVGATGATGTATPTTPATTTAPVTVPTTSGGAQ